MPQAPRAFRVLAFLALIPAPVAGQALQGRVVEHGAEATPIPGATVTLSGPSGRVLRTAIADSAGAFWLWNADPGEFRVSVARIGYAAVIDLPIRLPADTVVQIEIGLRPEAVPVDPIRVVSRREVRRYTVDEFYDRMGRLSDRGSFVTRDEIEASGALLPSVVLRRVPGTWVVPAGRSGFVNSISLVSYGKTCAPAIYLDGRQLRPPWTLDEAVMVDRIEGIEIYRGNFAPDGYHMDLDNWGCGFVMAWTKEGPDPRFAFTWGRTILFAVLGGLLLGLTGAF